MIAIVYKEKILQLIQSFPLDEAEDVSYYALKICRDLNINAGEITIIADGWIDIQSAVYLELMKFFVHVKFETADNSVSFDAAFSDFPLHFFSPLVNLAKCVS